MRIRKLSFISLRMRAALAIALIWGASAAAQPLSLVRQHADGADDARLLRFDGGVEPVSPAGAGVIDLIGYRIGGWTPNDATDSLFRGAWSQPADFLRLDLVFAGLVNPPGLGFPGNIFFFGDNPLLGFVEFDVDADPASGGELAGAQFRYQGAASRFGGIPQAPRFSGRMALNTCPGNFDADISTGPFHPERSGEEFHLALLWGAVTNVDVGSNGDFTFAAGETWTVRGYFLNRAHGFDDFILTCCSNGLPTYSPEVELLFSHSLDTDRTTVTLVYPLTQVGSAAEDGAAIEPLDCCASNQSSIEEGLAHISLSAQFASAADRNDVNFPLIAPWEFQNAADALNPVAWALNAVFVAVFEAPDTLQPELAWSDVTPNLLTGDFNADGEINLTDIALLEAFRADMDGGPCDADAIADGTYTLFDFGNGFDLHDLNYDGRVDGGDLPSPGEVDVAFDADGDGDVDLRDYGMLQRCAGLATGGFVPAECQSLDDNHDGVIDTVDLEAFTFSMAGP